MLNEDTEKKLSELVKLAWADKKLQKRLIEDPTSFIRENGIGIPEGVEASVVTDKDSISLQFNPKRLTGGDAELPESALDNVTGGLVFTFKLVAVKTVSW